MKQALAVILGLCIFPGGIQWLTCAQPNSATAAVPPQIANQPSADKQQAPTATAPPDEHPQQPETPPPANEPDNPQTPPAPPATPAKPAPAPKSRKKTATSGPKRRVVREGSTGEPTEKLSPAMSSEQASTSRQTTSQLLATAEVNLKNAAARTLTEGEQAMVAQIRKFMEQSNSAVAAGDFQRGRRLAVKARLLSDDLVKR